MLDTIESIYSEAPVFMRERQSASTAQPVESGTPSFLRQRGSQAIGANLPPQLMGNLAEPFARLAGRVTGAVEAFLRLLERWDLTAERGAKLLGDTDPGVVRDLRTGVAGIQTRDKTDRVRHILTTYSRVNRYLRDEAAERRWIRLKRKELGDKSLLDTMLGGSIEDLLIAREFVEQYVNE